MKKSAALCGLGALLLFLAVFGRRETALMPTNLRVGDSVTVTLARTLLQQSDSTIRTVDVVLVSRDCAACRALVDQLARRGGAPRPHHRAVFITDRVWSQLLTLRGERTSIVSNDTVARAIGLRATPTLIAYGARTSRVHLVAVGATAVLDRFPAGLQP